MKCASAALVLLALSSVSAVCSNARRRSVIRVLQPSTAAASNARASNNTQCEDCPMGICCSPGVACGSKWPDAIASLALDLSEAHRECFQGAEGKKWGVEHGSRSAGPWGCGKDCPAENCCLANCFAYDKQHFLGQCVEKNVTEACPPVACSLC